MNEIWGPKAGALPASTVTREPFVFTGTTKEYFGIWIVNVLLTILTLGIYSAWAKVRRQRYFYGNTFLAGASFDYHALPMRILIGRVLVIGFLIAYNLTLNFFPLVGLAIGIAFIFAVPWFLMHGLRFSARVTSYRNVHFDFTGGYGGAFVAYVLGGALIYGSGGILAPLASRWMWRYTLDNLRYGDRPISCDPRLDKLYGQWVLPALVVIGAAFFASGLLVTLLAAYSDSVSTFLEGQDSQGPDPLVFLIVMYGLLIPFFVIYGVVGFLYTAGIRNVVLNETVVDGRHALHSSIGRWRYTWISISNIVATLFTLGLARPWAAIRMAKYMAACTALDTTGSLDRYASAVQPAGSAVGSEYLDVEGFDFGF